MGWIEVTHESEATLAVDASSLFQLLRHPEVWGPMLPYVESVRREGEVYRWSFQEMIVVGIRLRPSFETVQQDDGAREVRWSGARSQPFRSSGVWQLTARDPCHTHLRVRATFGAQLELPAPMVAIALPGVRRHFGRQIEQLLRNLASHVNMPGDSSVQTTSPNV